MHLVRSLLAALLYAAPLLVQALPIRVVNEAGLSQPQIAAMLREYRAWAQRVYTYNRVQQPLPVNLVITQHVAIGYYWEPNVYLPVSDADEMLETWIHELAHHATGHQSSFFFKEGIAAHTLEKLFTEDGRIPQGFPQYGQPNDVWVRLFLEREQLPPLRRLMALHGYDVSTREADFRSWQTYIVGASFVGWLIRTQGYAAFSEAFREEQLGARAAELERGWRETIRAQGFVAFDPADYLPSSARYRHYAERLRAGTAPHATAAGS